MSQFVLTSQERIEAVQRLGYTEREAAFLCLAALHGGFFLRRQYAQFIHRQVGGTVAELVRKVLAHGHATSVTGCHNTKVYHLSSRPFYAALGQEDNRNRRTRPPVVIKNRLMCLDLVLDRAVDRILATEQEKVPFFTRELNVDPAELPAKVFRGVGPKQTTKRFFPDRYPILVPGVGEDGLPKVSFSFIDEGLITTARFETYLQEYGRLFAALKRFHVIYVAASPSLFGAAQAAFETSTSRECASAAAQLGEAELRALFDHFETRGLFEARQLESFDREKLIRFRDDRERFSGPAYDFLYGVWKVTGEVGIREQVRMVARRADHTGATFETHLLKQNYELFGYLRPQAEAAAEAVVEMR